MDAKFVKLAIAAAAIAGIAAGDQPKMERWLLTRGNQVCTMFSPSHPSQGSQIRNCGWVASNAPCAAPVEDGDWPCQDLLDELLGN